MSLLLLTLNWSKGLNQTLWLFYSKARLTSEFGVKVVFWLWCNWDCLERWSCEWFVWTPVEFAIGIKAKSLNPWKWYMTSQSFLSLNQSLSRSSSHSSDFFTAENLFLDSNLVLFSSESIEKSLKQDECTVLKKQYCKRHWKTEKDYRLKFGVRK